MVTKGWSFGEGGEWMAATYTFFPGIPSFKVCVYKNLVVSRDELVDLPSSVLTVKSKLQPSFINVEGPKNLVVSEAFSV